MLVFDRRSNRRKKACVQASASDPGHTLEVNCVVGDVNAKGCRIISSRIGDLPDVIQLIPEGTNAPIRGKIVWRHGHMAGLRFEPAASERVRASIEGLCNTASEDGGETCRVQDVKEDCTDNTDTISPPRT